MKESQCSPDLIPVRVTPLPGTLVEVGAVDTGTNIKTLGKLFVRDPAAAVREAPEWFFVSHQMSKEFLEKNAPAEYAPEPVRQYVQGLKAGDRAVIVLHKPGADPVPELRYAVFERGVSLLPGANGYCASRKPGPIGDIRLVIPK